MAADGSGNGGVATGSLDFGANRWLRQGSDLPSAERRLLGLIVRSFIAEGSAPGTAALQAMAGAADVDLKAALASLSAHDLVVLGADASTLLGAYPFSAVPTAHRVTIEGGATAFAMCAVDALGIAFLAGRNTSIDSHDASSNAPLHFVIDVQSGSAVADQPGIVMFSPAATYEGSAASCICPVIAFFGSAAAAENFARTHPEYNGRIMPLNDAVIVGRRLFEDPGNFFLMSMTLPAC